MAISIPGTGARFAKVLAGLSAGVLLLAAILSAWMFFPTGEAWRNVIQNVSDVAERHPEWVFAAYFVLFALGTVLMLPGVLFWGTLAGGYLFGWPVGLALSLSGGRWEPSPFF